MRSNIHGNAMTGKTSKAAASARGRRHSVRVAAGGAAVIAVAVGAMVGGAGGANALDPSASARTVYEAKMVNQHTVLGPQSAPTTLVTSPPLSGGTYQVSAIVGGVIFSSDQIVCSAYQPGHNDGVFGTAGNPAAGTQGGIYATASISDTVTVEPGQRIALSCNSFNPGRGTFATEAVLELRPASVYK